MMAGASEGETIVKPPLLPVAFTFTLAEAVLLLSARLDAVTVTAVVVFALGAVNRPVAEILPALLVQLTLVWVVPLTTAANCIAPPGARVAVAGETIIVI